MKATNKTIPRPSINSSNHRLRIIIVGFAIAFDSFFPVWPTFATQTREIDRNLRQLSTACGMGPS